MTAPGVTSQDRRQLLEKLRQGKSRTGRQSFDPTLFRPSGSRIPLSPGQERVWLHAQLAGEAPIYNESVTIHKRGALDPDILQQCFLEIARRHETWRSSFHAADGKVVQQIESAIQLPIPFTDLSHLPVGQREEAANTIATADLETPFNLNNAPLFRVRLIRWDEDRHRIYLTAHHLVFDGVSLYRVLLAELAALYAAFSEGLPSRLPELSAQYRDYVGWKRHLLERGSHESDLDYWCEVLRGDWGTLEIPTDRPRPARPTWRGGVETCSMPAGLLAKLDQIGKAEGVTRYMLLVAVFQVLLYRYSGQDDIAVGSTINTRTRPDFEPLIGYFLNTVVLRTRLESAISFRQLLVRVKSTVLGAIDHSEIPFDSIVRKLAPKRDPRVHPLFQVLFSMRPPFTAAADGWEMTSMEVHNGASSFDLFVEFSEQAGGLAGRFVYNSDLFERATVERLVRNFQVLLTQLLSDPGQAISAVDVMTAEERQTVLVDWNQTDRTLPTRPVHELFEVQAEAVPSKPALRFRGRQLSYGELNARANQLAHYLRQSGVGHGSLIGLYMERSFEMVVALMAVLKSGAAYVPYDPELPIARLRTMLQDSSPRYVITQRKLSRNLAEYRPRAIVIDVLSQEIANQPQSNPGVPVVADQAAYAIYTSGSTGMPKAAINAHGAVANRICWMQHQYQLEPHDRVLQKTPYTFDVSVWEFFWPLAYGATLVIAAPGGHRDPEYLADLIGAEGITTIHFVPSMLREFLEARGLDRTRCLRRVFSSGEALPPDLCQKFSARLEAELHNLYGPTEAAVDVTYWDCRNPSPCASVPIGRPISNVRIYILDQHLEPVPIGVAGELYIGGVAVGCGYLNRPQLTSERFIPDPFSGNPTARLYKTGDRARFLAGGNIEYLGRLDHQVKLRGFRIEPGEIEAALLQTGQVAAAAVVLNSHNDSPRLVAYVVPGGSESDVSRLRAALRDQLPQHMIPASFVFVEALPKTSSGKLDKQLLPAPQHGTSSQQTFASARDQIEERLVNIWEEVLGFQPISIDDNFFDAGGHSLLALRLFSQINLSFQLKLPLATLFYAPTVRGIARIIRDSAVKETASPIVPIQTKGTKPAIYCIGPLTGEVLMFRDLAIELGPDQPIYGLQPFHLPNRPAAVEGLAASYIEELRRFGESRPFCVVGYSFGGAVALEIAQQLLRQGIDPPLVVMIDSSYLAGCKTHELFQDRIRRYKYHVSRIVRGAGGLNHLADRLRSRGYRTIHKVSAIAGVGIQRIVTETARIQLLAAEDYRPRKYPRPVLLLKAETRPEFFDKPDLGWGPILSDLRIEHVPGNHNSIRTDQNLKILAQKLADYLEFVAKPNGSDVGAPRRFWRAVAGDCDGLESP